MAAIVNYTTLGTEILRALERTNDLEAQAQVPLWIQNAEDDFFAHLRAQWTVRTARFIWNTTEHFEFLPPTFNGVVGLTMPSYGIDLKPKPFSQYGMWSLQVGLPEYYLISGYMLWVLPEPDPDTELYLTYYSRQERLATTNQTNDIIVNMPTLYLKAALKHAYAFYGEKQNSADAEADAQRLINAANNVEPEWFRGAGATVTLGV